MAEEIKKVTVADSATQNNQAEEQPIDWTELVAKLLKHKKYIIIVTLIFAVLGVGFALTKKHQYTVTVTLAPEIDSKSGSSSLKGIASMLGLSGLSSSSSGVDAVNFTMFPEICSSTPFLTGLFDVPVTTHLTKKDIKRGKKAKTTTLFKYITKEDEPKKGLFVWLADVLGAEKPEKEDNSKVDISNLTRMQSQVVRILERLVTANVDTKTGITTLTITMDDPKIATTLADTVCQRLQDYVSDYRTQKAKKDLLYYSDLAHRAHQNLVKAQAAYAQSVDFDHSVILQSVNSEKQRLQAEANLAQQVYEQMEQQKVAAKAKYQEMKPVFAVIQPATMPQRPSGTSRKTIVLGFMFLGFVISAGWKLYAKDFVDKTIKDIKEKKKNLE